MSERTRGNMDLVSCSQSALKDLTTCLCHYLTYWSPSIYLNFMSYLVILTNTAFSPNLQLWIHIVPVPALRSQTLSIHTKCHCKWSPSQEWVLSLYCWNLSLVLFCCLLYMIAECLIASMSLFLCAFSVLATCPVSYTHLTLPTIYSV